MSIDQATGLRTRGTTNGNDRGNSTTRRQRREWLVETYRADVDAAVLRDVTAYDNGECIIGIVDVLPWDPILEPFDYTREPAARCYRCAALLVVDTVTADRIVAGAHGGKYGTPTRDRRDKRTNLRPACGPCNSETGGGTRRR